MHRRTQHQAVALLHFLRQSIDDIVFHALFQLGACAAAQAAAIGLAVDIVDANNATLTSAQAKTATQKWLMENCWRYGFILRYPEGKSDITGIIYEPWHYRYVGYALAKELHFSGMTLEEYLGE